MQKRSLLLSLIALMAIGVIGVGTEKLVVYTYSSFASWGAAPFIEEAFEKKHDVDVQFVATGDARMMLTKLLTEREAGRPGADVFVGVGSVDLSMARGEDLFVPLTGEDIPNLASVREDLLIDPTNSLIPYEHSYVTLVYDSQVLAVEDVPLTFEQLLDPKYKKMLILEDPRTSSVGLAFLLWTIHQYGDPGYLDYWRKLLPNVLTITQGWSAAYDLFLAREAPIVVSFSTDTAYSVIEEGSARYKVMLLNSQGYRSIYLMGIVKGTKQQGLCKELLDFVLSPEVQERISTTEWMFPANRKTLLPVLFYQNAVFPPDPVMVPSERIGENLDRWLLEWAGIIVGG